MPQRFHVTPAQGIAQLAALLLLLLWLIKLRCRTWATRLYSIGLLIAAFAIPFALAGQTDFAPFGAFAVIAGLVVAMCGIVLDTRRGTRSVDGAAAVGDEAEPRQKKNWLTAILSPGLLNAGLLVAVCALWSAEHYGWLKIARQSFKGWPVLIAAAFVGATVLVISVWWAAGTYFRWRFQLTRMAWLAFTAAAAIVWAWYAAAIGAAHFQYALDAELASDGGSISYDSETILLDNPLAALLGRGFFTSPILIVLPHKAIDDRLVDEINQETTAEVVCDQVTGLHLTDSQLEPFARLRNLRDLKLGSCPAVTDAGLKQLHGLTKLERLYIQDSRITDEGLRNLAGLKNLRTLWLDRTSVTGTGFKYLRGLSKLQDLTLASMPLTDAGLAEVGRLTTLTNLNLAYSPVGDPGIAQLKNLKQLRVLLVRDTKITSESAKTLQSLPGLQFLDIGRSRQALFGKFKSALPYCNVMY